VHHVRGTDLQENLNINCCAALHLLEVNVGRLHFSRTCVGLYEGSVLCTVGLEVAQCPAVTVNESLHNLRLNDADIGWIMIG